MPLFLVAIVEPELVAKYQGDVARDEQLILSPTPVLAPNYDAAKILAVQKAPISDKTDPKRWEVIVRPFE